MPLTLGLSEPFFLLLTFRLMLKKGRDEGSALYFFFDIMNIREFQLS